MSVTQPAPAVCPKQNGSSLWGLELWFSQKSSEWQLWSRGVMDMTVCATRSLQMPQHVISSL